MIIVADVGTVITVGRMDDCFGRRDDKRPYNRPNAVVVLPQWREYGLALQSIRVFRRMGNVS